MRRRITMLVMAAIMALTMSFGGAAAAFAEPTQNQTQECNQIAVQVIAVDTNYGTINPGTINQTCTANFASQT
jgi:hypothetical protein